MVEEGARMRVARGDEDVSGDRLSDYLIFLYLIVSPRIEIRIADALYHVDSNLPLWYSHFGVLECSVSFHSTPGKNVVLSTERELISRLWNMHLERYYSEARLFADYP